MRTEDTSIKKFVGDIGIRKLVVEECYSSLFHTKYNIICHEKDFLDRNVVLINTKGIVKDIVTCDKNFGSYDDTYGAVRIFNDSDYIYKDYR